MVEYVINLCVIECRMLNVVTHMELLLRYLLPLFCTNVPISWFLGDIAMLLIYYLLPLISQLTATRACSAAITRPRILTVTVTATRSLKFPISKFEVCHSFSPIPVFNTLPGEHGRPPSRASNTAPAIASISGHQWLQ